MKKSTTIFRMLAFLALVTFVFWGGTAMGQGRTVTGKVTSADDQGGLPGVNVVQKGTTRGVITDANGNYSINVSGNESVLVYSFVGFDPQEITVGNRSIINVGLVSDGQALSEVVVTALGIKREERSLGYSIGKVDGKDLQNVVQENVLNSLAGRVSGVTINSTGGTGSSVSMVIRGANSLNGDNQPLFVVDGIPISNTLNNVSTAGNDNRVDFGNAIGSLNPDDIESISILKGPSAAALYGSRAGNGVVLITTKSGANVNKMTVSVTNSTVFDRPYKYLKWQTRLGSGQFSAIPPEISGTPLSNPFGKLVEENVAATYGAALDKGYEEVQWNSPLDEKGKAIKMPLVSYPNNAENFVQTGITTTNGIAVANNATNYNYRLSYSNMWNRGIIPNSDLFRNTINLNTSVKVSEKFRVSSVVDFSRNNSNNRPAGNRGANPLEWVYKTSPHINILDLKDYWMPGQEGLQQRTPYNGVFNNPYFLAYEVNNAFVRDRIYGNVRADYQITPELSVFARYSLDKLDERRDMKVANSYKDDPNGAYALINIGNFEHNVDFLATYQKDFNDLSFSLSAGGNSRYQKGSTVNNSTKGGTGLIVPGLFSIQNIAPNNLDYYSNWFQKGINSVYGLMNLGFKEMVFLDVTARNDWSSTLPEQNRSYFYPSASLSVLANEFIPMGRNVSLFKLRGGYAQVGNDAEPYKLLSTLGNRGAWEGIPRLGTSGTLLIPDLKPEIVTSYEGGIDLNFFTNRLRFSGTYYIVENRNQILSTKLPPSSGYITKNVNAGLLRSKGWELGFGFTPVSNRDFRWDINTNWTRNRTTIVELADDLPYYTLWTDAKGGAWTYVGEELGDIYDAEIVTVKDKNSPYYGFPILDATGKWQSIDAVNTKNKIGNFNPKFIMGLQSDLRYKGFNLNFSLDWRNGGDFVSQTYRYGEEDGRSQLFYDKLFNPGTMTGKELRDYLMNNKEEMILIHGNVFPLVGGPTPDDNSYPFKYGPYTLPYGGVIVPGVIATGYDEKGNPTGFIENLGEKGTQTLPFAGATTWSFTRAFLYDASYVKLREISLGYDLPKNVVQTLGMQNINLSVYSRNIMLWTKAKINIDPERAYQMESSVQGGISQFKQGIERYNVTPWVMPVGFRIGITF